MTRHKDEDHIFSRRTFLGRMRWAPLLFLPAPIHASPFPSMLPATSGDRTSTFPFADFRLTPHYPAKSPLDDVLRLVAPGTDEYLTEKYAFEIMRLLNEWSQGLKATPPALAVLAKFLDPSIEATPLVPAQEKTVRSGNGIEVFRRQFSTNVVTGRERFLQEIKTYLTPIARLETAEFEIVGIEETAGSPPKVQIDIRYDIVGTRTDNGREMNQTHGESFDGRPRGKHSAGPANRFSLTLLPKPWAKRNRTRISCFTESIIGARFSTGRAGSTFTATMAWRWEISTTTDWMICTSANPQGFPTGFIAIAVMGHSRM